LLAIGLKGGIELAETSVGELWRPLLAALALSIITPFVIFAVTRTAGRLSVPDAAALAAHHGSVSVVTFTAATTFLVAANVEYEGFMPTLLAVMEVPAIVVALILARTRAPGGGELGEALREVVTGRSIVLLLGGLAIGAIVGREGLEPVAPLFVALFPGLLTLFLLEMGIVAAARMRDLRTGGVFLVGFGIAAPLVLGAAGVVAGSRIGTLGGWHHPARGAVRLRLLHRSPCRSAHRPARGQPCPLPHELHRRDLPVQPDDRHPDHPPVLHRYRLRERYAVTTSLRLLTIVAEAVLEDQLVRAVHAAGRHGPHRHHRTRCRLDEGSEPASLARATFASRSW
jgi:hypothetical protein